MMNVLFTVDFSVEKTVLPVFSLSLWNWGTVGILSERRDENVADYNDLVNWPWRICHFSISLSNGEHPL